MFLLFCVSVPEPHKKLTLLYLANDVVQNSKRRGPEYTNEFGEVMPHAMKSLTSVDMDAKTKQAISRLLNIWKERAIFDDKLTHSLLATWTNPSSTSGSTPETASVKRPSTAASPVPNGQGSKKPKVAPAAAAAGSSNGGKTPDEAASTPCEPDGPPPSPAVLIDAMKRLEKSSASGDADIRGRIAKFVPFFQPLYDLGLIVIF
jgi:regulator of Ty1 transposition protein 103